MIPTSSVDWTATEAVVGRIQDRIFRAAKIKRPRLEPDDEQSSCPVLRGLGSGNGARLPDVAEAVTQLVANTGATSQPCCELGGPQIFTYEELLRTIARHIGARTRFMPMPFVLWHALAWISEHVPGAPLTRNQIALMQHDNVASLTSPGLPELGIKPTAIETVLPEVERQSATAQRPGSPV